MGAKSPPHGQQKDFVERTPDKGPDWQPEVLAEVPFRLATLCQKGKKAGQPVPPNQDNFSLTRLQNNRLIFCICDGHGQFGHWVSFKLCQSLPFFLAQREADICGSRPQEALDAAFTSAQED